MQSITELVRRGALVLLWAGVFIQCTLGLLPAGKEHAPRRPAPPSPARPWGLEARKVGQLGRRAYALRVQVVVVSLA